MAKTTKGSEAKLQKYGIFFVLPFIVIYLFFQLWPTIYTVLLSFTDMKGMKTQGFHGSKIETTLLSNFSVPEDDLEKGLLSPLYGELEVLAPEEKQVAKDFSDATLVTSEKIKQGNLLYDYSKKLAKVRYNVVAKENKDNASANLQALAQNRGIKVEDVKEVFGITVPTSGQKQKFILSKKFNLSENGFDHTYILEQEVVVSADASGKCALDYDQFIYEVGKNGSRVKLNAQPGDFASVFTYNKELTYNENGKDNKLLLKQLVTLDHEKGDCLIQETLYEIRDDGAYKLGDVKNGVVTLSKSFCDKNKDTRIFYLEQDAALKIEGGKVKMTLQDERLIELANNKKVQVGTVQADKNGKKVIVTKICSSINKESPNKVSIDKATTKCGGVHFVGLTNFSRLMKDKYFWGSIGNTFVMWLFNFIPQLGIALLFAIWFTDPRMRIKGKNAFRALFYMPNLLTAASVAILFRSLFGYPNGPINQFLYSLGIQSEVYKGQGVLNIELYKQSIEFFRSIPWSRGIVSFIQWWLWCGQTLIMLMAGITSISPSLYESAVVDGANQGQQTWYITLPLLKPMMLFILITGLIGGMQLFEIPFLLTDMYGGPQNKIRTMVLYMYNQSFQGVNDYSYGAAIAMGVFVITMALSMFIYFFMQDRSDMGRK